MSKYKFGKSSLSRLNTCHPDLIALCEYVLELGLFDYGITEGHRDEDKQNEYFNSGASHVKWPESKHNTNPSRAFDFILWLDGKATLEEKDLPSYYMAIGVFKVIAQNLGIKIKSGGDWDGDWSVTDQKLNDACHIELIGD